jgi:hypothetical protein
MLSIRSKLIDIVAAFDLSNQDETTELIMLLNEGRIGRAHDLATQVLKGRFF